MKRIGKVVGAGILCGLVLVGMGRGAVAAGAAPADATARVDLNSASAAELARLPGIGPAKAKAIVDYRNESPFRKPDELRNVKGIGDKLYERVKDQVTVGEPRSVPQDRGG
jgi:competence protein ComEA